MRDEQTIKKGQRYRTRIDAEVLFNTSWFAPFTGGGRGTIPAGTVLIIEHDPVAHAKGVSLLPENYAQIESLLVPASDRSDPKYGGFRIILLFEEIKALCDRLPT